MRDPPVSTTDPAPSPERNRPVTLPPPFHDDLHDFSDDVGSPAASAIDGEPTDLTASATLDVEPPTLEALVAGAVAMAEIENPAIDDSGEVQIRRRRRRVRHQAQLGPDRG